jgi:putative redox protein
LEYEVEYIGNNLFIGKSGDGRITIIDTRKQEERKYFSPMELLLLASAGCTAIDIVSILRKMRVDFEDLRVTVTGKRREEYPKIYEEFSLKYILKGKNIDREKVERAVKLSLDKYCSASITLKKAGAKLSYSIEIIDK